tara:strand:- start:250 stop:441 length:192 start_codon:yes stop_codon:yes gene_type:complete
MTAKIEVTINEDGTVDIDVNGVQGRACEKYTDALRQALDATVLSDNKKPEYYQAENTKVKITG